MRNLLVSYSSETSYDFLMRFARLSCACIKDKNAWLEASDCSPYSAFASPCSAGGATLFSFSLAKGVGVVGVFSVVWLRKDCKN